MIYIKDNFLDLEMFDNLLSTINDDDFKTIDLVDLKIEYHKVSDKWINYISTWLSIIEGADIENIACFIRKASDKIDTNWQIHNDGYIQGSKPDRACVLYLSKSTMKELHGTAFWEHDKHGESYDEVENTKEFDRLIKEDFNDISKWNLKSVVGYKQNRLISYPCNYFHSKYPNISWKEGRVVLVMFYKSKNSIKL